MQIIFNEQTRSKSGKGINLKRDDIFYNISYEVLEGFGISMEMAMEEFLIITDDEKEISSKGKWYFIKSQNILMIISDSKEIEKQNKIQKENINKQNEEFADVVFVEEKEQEEEKPEYKIDFDSVYDNLDFYKINEIKKNKMTTNQKLIQKSIKLKPTKYFNGKPANTDLNFSLIRAMTNEDISSFVQGKINSLKIRKLTLPKIPKTYKESPEKILNFLNKKGFLSFITKTDSANFLKGKISIKEMLDKALVRSDSKFNKIAKTFRESLMIKRETGVNPFVMAWPFVRGKTQYGRPIHAPLAYRDIEIRESLDEYELIISDFFTINTYPILKNYSDNNNEVNVIEAQHNNIKGILQEFYKHHIKVSRPESGDFIDYEAISMNDTSKWSPDTFQLMNEVILRVKPHDEFIFYDLKNIIKNNNDFSLPEMSYGLPENISSSNPKSFIFDVDNSKAYAINKAMNDSVVIFGPPGTGKSATITNIVGKLIETGSCSIFVAEKATAIEVIEKSLAKINMDYFVINLNNASKIDFKSKFKKLTKIISDPQFDEIKEIETIDFAKEWFKHQITSMEVYKNLLKVFDNDLEKPYELISVMQNSNSDLKSIFSNYKKWEYIEDIETKIKDVEKSIKKSNEKIKRSETALENHIDNSIKKANELSITLNFLKGNEDLINISNSKSTEELIKIVQNKKPIFFKKFVNNNNQEINQLKKIGDSFKTKNDKLVKSIEEENKELLIITEKDSNLKAQREAFNYPLHDFSLSIYPLLKDITNEQIRFLDDNLDKIINKAGETWEDHLKFKENKIQELRKAVINNYSVRMKKFLEDEDNLITFRRLATFIDNKLDRRNQSIIKTFKTSDAWKILIKVFPCLMMNPDHVSVIFPDDSNIFEYAIFDEASQIRLHRSIPTLHRSMKAIVAGDDKQLGPTDLFTDINRDEDDDLNLEEDTTLTNDTLLNYAKDKYFHVQLNTHYRSKSKDLIEFSNKTFYNGTIMTADTPKPSIDGNPPIVVEEIDGKWQEGRVNLEEAERAKELINHYINELNLSVLVITFNDQQKALIASSLDPSLLNSDKLMLKAIKDVQGDEMDVVIFSIAYGRRATSGQYVTFFGQFSKEKINVAITRGKYRIHVLKSIPSSALNPDNDDKLVFKRWLEHIESYSENKKDITDHINTFKSPLEEDYYKEFNKTIDSRFIPLMNYKIAGKEIDIVVYDSVLKEFIGAIELDGAKYHSDVDQVLNDYERQLFLENLGWYFVRTTFYEFYKNRSECIKENMKMLIDINK